jgi:DNA-binding CsgD family transcriptional regulator
MSTQLRPTDPVALGDAIAAAGAGPATPAPAATSGPEPGVPAGTLYGRGRELQLVDRIILRPQEQPWLVLSGEPGSGRTALLQAAERRADRAGHGVVHVTCGPARRDTGALADLGFALGLDRAGDATTLARRLAAAATDRPLVVLVEDAQWLGRRGWDELARIAALTRRDRVAVLAVTDERRDAHGTGLPVVALEGIDDAAAGALLDAMRPRLAGVVRERTLAAAGGNPLALVELARRPVEAWQRLGVRGPAALPVSDRLRDALTRRLDALGPLTRAVVLAAAANDGASVGETVAAASLVTGAPSSQVVAAVALAVAHDELLEADGRLRFRHEAARAAVYAAAGIDARRAIHLALADVVGQRPERRAWHRVTATLGADETVADAAYAAAAAARSRDRLLDALALIEQSARVTSTPRVRVDRLLEAAELAHAVGRPDRAAQLAGRVRASAAATEADRRRLEAVRARFHLRPRDRAAAEELLGDVEALGAAGERGPATRLLVDVARDLQGRSGAGLVRDRVVALADRLGTPAEEPLLAVALTAAAPARGPEALRAATARTDTQALSTETRVLLAGAAIDVADDALAVALLSSAVTDLRADGHVGLLSEALRLRGWTAARTATVDAARADLAEARTLAEAYGHTRVLARLPALEALLEALCGRAAQADRLAADAEGAVAGWPAARAELELVRGLARLGERRHAEAFERFERLWEMGDGDVVPVQARRIVAEYADAARHAGESYRARTRLAGLAPAGGVHAAGLALARALLDDGCEAGAALEAALAAAAGDVPARRGQAHLALGEWLRRERRRRDAQAQLELAREAFAVCGATAWEDRAATELRAAGAATVHRAPDQLDDLTAQELQIARLAADGLSNREIGARLYLSHRTIGSHLYRVFPKLGITTRTQLGRALAELGVGADAVAG